ncbi:hypothetical protein TKK_0018229 [Trichogramma kaykai]|uniref:Uncharacterized protein n=1 Tax=Trichogramma kaykai TaxID=54128 RepID=A0ABD2VYW1_9HYME
MWPNDFQIPRFADLLGLHVFENPGQKLFDAMSSISRHDDYRCVPRILCEITSGSTSGESSYRSARPTTGQILLFNLLSAFDRSGASPLILFGKAALLGYVYRGDPRVCYQEYPRCPRDQQELIVYLNNYKGGFFRFFTMNNDYLLHSETPQQEFGLWTSMRPEYFPQKPSNNNNKLPNLYEFSSGTAFYNPQQTFYQNPFVYNHVESETKWPSYMHGSRIGKGKLSFSNEEYFSQYNDGVKIALSEFDNENTR